MGCVLGLKLGRLEMEMEMEMASKKKKRRQPDAGLLSDATICSQRRKGSDYLLSPLSVLPSP